MSNGPTHQIAAAAIVGGICLHKEAERGEKTLAPFVNAALAALTTNLPDILEPANNPNHRQFFHGLAFAAVVAKLTHELYQWEPQNENDALIRSVLLVVGGGFLIHLFLDFLTPKSLPLVGKI